MPLNIFTWLHYYISLLDFITSVKTKTNQNTVLINGVHKFPINVTQVKYLKGSIGHVLQIFYQLHTISALDLSPVLKPLSHAGATMQQLDTPVSMNRLIHSYDLVTSLSSDWNYDISKATLESSINSQNMGLTLMLLVANLADTK